MTPPLLISAMAADEIGHSLAQERFAFFSEVHAVFGQDRLEASIQGHLVKVIDRYPHGVRDLVRRLVVFLYVGRQAMEASRVAVVPVLNNRGRTRPQQPRRGVIPDP